MRSQCQGDLSDQIKQQRDLLKNGLVWALLNLSVCPVGDVATHLNCCKLSADNSYKVYMRKIQNVCPG
jgi:hypothetical protein